KYYWRLSVRGGIPGTESVSAVRSFSVAEEKKITEPEKIVPDENRKISGEPEKISLISPKNNAIIDMSKNDFVFFRWSENRNATEYTFRLFLDSSKRKLLHEEKLKTNDLKFSDLSKLDKGNFSWEVEAKIKSPEGEMKSISGSGKFRIILSEDLKSPEFQTQ
ncbi:MAG: hypothetical protein K8R21_14995, partial [Leptospira sp.]|nr:hypothetical protein [Leptospira sp.]